jgi:hypothetical protein
VRSPLNGSIVGQSSRHFEVISPMDDQQIIERLRALRSTSSAVQLAEELACLLGSWSDAALVMFFARAFPDIPLKVLRDAGGWERVSGGRLTDGEFEELLGPWLKNS